MMNVIVVGLGLVFDFQKPRTLSLVPFVHSCLAGMKGKGLSQSSESETSGTTTMAGISLDLALFPRDNLISLPFSQVIVSQHSLLSELYWCLWRFCTRRS